MQESGIVETKRKFSKEEDERLKELVEKQHMPWSAIGMILNRKPNSCRGRYEFHLQNKYVYAPFTSEEDNTILVMYSKYGSQWELIANHLSKRRTVQQVKNRFKCLRHTQQIVNRFNCYYLYIQQIANDNAKSNKPSLLNERIPKAQEEVKIPSVAELDKTFYNHIFDPLK